VIYDANRILRIVNTRHMGSGLYKIPLSAEQLSSLSIDEIKRQATSQSQDDDLIDSYVIFNFPQEWEKYLKKEEKPKLAVVQNNDTMPTLLPARVKVLGEARAALELGYFEKGERSNALMILCSSYRAQGISIEIAYRMLKGVVELQTARTGQEKFSNDELWTNIVSQIYSPNWKGGIYRYEDTPLLQEVTSRLGLRPPGVQEALEVFKIEDIGKTFRKFATNIETNTIKLGIKEIDDNIRITTSMLVGLVGAPAGGKTSAAFDILHNASNAGTKCMMFSMDMGAPLVFQRLIQKHTGIRSRELYEHYKTGDDKVEEFESQLAEHYKNVSFCFKSGLTVEDLREQLIKRQQEIGEPIKLVVVDYLETMTSSLVDTVSSHSYISQKLKDVANELECTVVLLLQPQKLVGGPADAILNYTKIKGSSAIQQACSVIISVWREGFNPKHPEDDRYISFAVLKNRMGSLGSWNFSWDGLRGAIRSMTDDELVCFNQLMSKKENEKAEEL
jgi:KaiC/GvpD/RAD55 family RecA-like ATPase